MAAFILGFALVLGSGAAQAQPRPSATVDSGPLLGVSDGAANVFKGIPYAASAAGEGRWAPPAPPARWTAPRDASDYGPICVQGQRPDGVQSAGAGRPQSEDCLSLNVWTPVGARRAPVMVWIHGGAHRFGSGAGPVYDGAAFARDGVILVTLNYRLGALGYFAHPALTKAAKADAPLGSYGLMDQMAALVWVKKNIAAFGGDPANVTVFGESAGGSSILALLATPSAKGLFDKAIVESGGGWQAPPTLPAKEKEGVALATGAGLPGADATLAQLRALPIEKLLATGGGAGGVGPIVDGRLTKLSPSQAFTSGAAIDVPLLIGSNSFEASLMRTFPIPPAVLLGRLSAEQRALYAAAGSDEAAAQAAYTDVVMGAPARWVAGKAADGAPAWLYHFSYVATAQRGQTPGAVHGGEIVYVFGSGSKLAGRRASDEDKAMETMAHACWIAFARTGRPACAGAPAWPAYTPADDHLLEFGTETALRHNFRKPFMDAAEKAARF